MEAEGRSAVALITFFSFLAVQRQQRHLLTALRNIEGSFLSWYYLLFHHAISVNRVSLEVTFLVISISSVLLLQRDKKMLEALWQALEDAYDTFFVAIPPWRERACVHRRVGVWDPRLVREICSLPDGRQISYFIDGPPLHRPSDALLDNENEESSGADNIDEINNSNTPIILCLHAMMLSGNVFLASVPPTDFTLICVNRSGYMGTSPDPAYSYTRAAQDLEYLLLEHLQIQSSPTRPLVVLGHSSGGPVALAMAHEWPPTQRPLQHVILLAPDPEYALPNIPPKPWWKRLLLGTVLPILLQILAWTTGDLVGARGLVNGVRQDYTAETSLYDFDVEQACTNNTTTAVHVCVGDQDTMLPPSLVQHHVASRLPPTKTTLTVLPDVSHLGIIHERVFVPLLRSILWKEPSPWRPTREDETATRTHPHLV